LNRQGDFVMVPYSTRSPIKYSIPELLYLDGGLKNVVPYDGTGVAVERDQGVLHKLMNIWATDWIQHSLVDDGEFFILSLHLQAINNPFSRFSFCFPSSFENVSQRSSYVV
jgi:hypothetical protein